MDLVHAKSERAQAVALHALEGQLAIKLEAIRERLITILAHIEAHIDFPDEDISPDSRASLTHNLADLLLEIRMLLNTATDGKILRHGISVAIIGRPNVGKSLLMNRLLGSDRSIVTDVPGTTRDIIEDFASIHGIPIRLTDTAGIRKTMTKVEGAGVDRTRRQIPRSDIVLHVMDRSRRFAVSELHLAELYSGKPCILVLNKCDLPEKLSVPHTFPCHIHVNISALTNAGIDELKRQITSIAGSGTIGSTDLEVAVNERQADSLRRAQGHLASAKTDLDNQTPLEIVAQSLRTGLSAVGDVVGKTATEDILTKIFSTFCIGK
jgi:tRNA modification GTPase